jgi:hypothetical protein
MNRLILLAVAAATLIGGCSARSEGHRPTAGLASMPYNEFGEIRDWRSDGAGGLYIESDGRKWYHATFFTPCANLPFATHIELRPIPQYPGDRFNSIELLGETCSFKTFDQSSDPPAQTH